LFATIVPSVALPPVMPLTLQVTPDEAVPETVTVKTCAPPVGTLAAGGATDTTILLCNRVTDAEPLACASAWLTAVTVTVAGLGIVPGAVYSPDGDTVPKVEFPPAMPFTFQETAPFDEFVTVA
jgi:hypothetical protein